MMRLSNKEQEKRLEDILHGYSSLWWKKNKKGRYPVRREEKKESKSSLWIRITYGKENFTITTTGNVASDIKVFINKTLGRPGKEARVTHVDWNNVRLNDVKIILDEFSK